MPQFINGPANFAHLRGTINGIDKDIYLFMDYHYALDMQTRCESFDSIDISQYLYKLIKDTKIPLDFFIEIRTKQINQSPTIKRDIYINEIFEMFKSEFIVEKINNKDVVKYSKTNKNVRLHYIDIRDHFDLFYILHIIKYDIFTNFDLLIKNGINKEYIDKILNSLKTIKHILNVLVQNMDEIIYNEENKYDKNNKDESQKYYINKIINNYEDDILKEKINTFLYNHFTYITKVILLPFRTVYPYIKYYNGKQNEQINEKIQEINDLSIDLYSLFVDTYLLRRILDKKYINNCVVYTGAHHSVNYIYFLIKYCDFKLINIHNSVEKDINKITDLIKNTENVYDIYSLIYLKKKIYLQCIKYEDIKSNYHRYMGSRIVY